MNKTHETAWLIEWPNHEAAMPMYYGKLLNQATLKRGPSLGPTPDSLDAIRFSRKEDAEAVLNILCSPGARAAEHMWIGRVEIAFDLDGAPETRA